MLGRLLSLNKRLQGKVVSKINPIAETSDNKLAADAKLNFDDNAAFHQKEIFALRGPTQKDPRDHEINPIAETSNNKLVAADAKLNFNDIAAFCQKEIFALRGPTQEDPRDREVEMLPKDRK